METVARADRGEKALSPEQQQRDERRKVYPPLSQDELSRLFAYLRNRAKREDGTFSPTTWALLVLLPNESDPRRARLRNASEEQQLYARYTSSDRPWTATECLVMLVILRACGVENDSGAFVACLSLHRLALLTGLSRNTVRRVIRQLDEHPYPLIQSTLSSRQQTRGYSHRSYRFELVSNPVTFAKARDRARTRILSEYPRSRQNARNSIPREVINALGTQCWIHNEFTEAELHAKIDALVDDAMMAGSASRRLPKRVTAQLHARPPALRLAPVGVPR